MSDPYLEEAPGALVSRRAFLGGTASALPLAYAAAHLDLAVAADRRGRLIVRQKDPDNLEFPFATLNSFITPNDMFYVRNHFSVPKLDHRTWRLKVEGAVNKELELTYDQLRKLPARTVTATLECSGNNRSYLRPPAKGVPWGLGAVGNAKWTGVPLAAVLERAGAARSAVEVILEGADVGELPAEPRPTGKVHFARSLPLSRAEKLEVLLAYRMNGHDLPTGHGFPLRAVVPGWYGVASVKWLRRLVVATKPFTGFFQTFDYSYFTRYQGMADVVPVREMQVKAQIARPAAGEVVGAGSRYRVHGAAWTGDSEIARVEVSTDGGRSWHRARLADKPARYAWCLWEYPWRTPSRPGAARLLARATDARGRAQPLHRDPDRRNYMISHVLSVDVTVK
jgi:DMSO/TMAO reductase YedYZ molybdopterin-dependent catalytic subunit